MKFFSHHLICSYNNFYFHSYFSQLVKPCTVICCCWFNDAGLPPFSKEHKRSFNATVIYMYYANNAHCKAWKLTWIYSLRIVGYSEEIIYSYVVVSSEGHGILLARNVKGVLKRDRTFAIKTLQILQHFKHCPLLSSPLYWGFTVPSVSSIVEMLPGTHFLWRRSVLLSHFPEPPLRFGNDVISKWLEVWETG